MLNGLNTDDPEIVKQCLRDIVALATLPAMWTGAEPLRVAESLAASLFTTIGAEFVCVYFRGVAESASIAVAQVGRYETSCEIARALEARIAEWTPRHDPDEILVLPNPLGDDLVRITTRAIGHHAEFGVIAAAFTDSEEPSGIHHLILNVAATQAATAIQNAHLLQSVRAGEDHIRRTNIELAERVAELQQVNVDLRDSRQSLRDADRRKDEFLATLAHELRNPLAPLRNGLELLSLTENDPRTVEHVRTMMERQMTQLVRLVDDLLDVSRITRGKLTLRTERVTLARVVESAVETSTPLVEHMGHALSVSLPDGPIPLDADATRLSQVFANLLNNAAKYTPRGGSIAIACERQDDWVAVSVRDNGIGIPADQLPTIFDMFAQVDRSIERSQGGLGIGLTLARRLVAMHGGTITARSDGSGSGAEFIVRLPIAVTAHDAPLVALDEPAAATSALRILVVDDNRDSAESLSMMLAMMGNDIRTTYDGEQAVAAAVEFQPHVILLDIGLPKISGYEACRRIREQTNGTRPIIIAQTGWGQDADRTRTRDAGFDLHLVKPVNPKALMRTLHEYALQPRP
jgi:signal transduction histidine kinase/ActR/RegA family two-component response regulator